MNSGLRSWNFVFFATVLAGVCILVGPRTLQAQEGYLSKTLSLESEGPEVSLLQSWLAKDSQVYPEGLVTGVFGEATKRAVERYQQQKGMILGSAGAVGPMTRANLNADFSNTQGGVAVVEATYGDALRFDGENFLPLEETSYDVDGSVHAALQIWAHSHILTEREYSLLEDGEGNGVGITEQGKLYAVMPERRAVTANAYIKTGEWQHVAVRFLESEAVFIFNNTAVEVVPFIQLPEQNFLFRISSSIMDTLSVLFGGNTDVRAPELAVVAAETSQGTVASFWSRIGAFFGFLPAKAPVAEVSESGPHDVPPVEESAPAQEEETTTQEEQEEDASRIALIPAPPPAPATSPLATVKASTTVVAVATTSPSVGTTTATQEDEEESDTQTSRGSSDKNRAPEITLSGSAQVSITVGSVYTDPGASAEDDEDGDLTGQIVIGGDEVDHTETGTYLITYNVSDSSDKAATEVVRTVVVTAQSIPVSEQQPNYPLPPAGQTVSYSVSNASDADPKFVSAEIKPLHVYVGDTQTFTVKVSSVSGITSVTSRTELDTTTLNLDLVKTKSEASGDTYSASWVVHDTHTQVYRTTFTAENGAGDENEVTLAWSDPCPGITQGTNSSVTSNCSISTVGGLDGGSATINNGVTLTINNGGTWAFNPGTSITVNGAIVKASGGLLRKGYLFYALSGATYDTATMIFSTNSSESNHTRVNTYAQSYYESFYQTSYK